MRKQFGIFILLVSMGFLFQGNSDVYSQNYRFTSFGLDDGLSDNFIYNITQSPNGYLWLGTGEGISRFDGFNFTRVFPGDSLPASPVRRSFVDSRNLVWFGYDNGNIALLQGIKFRLIIPDENYRNAIKGFAEDSKGNILVATQGKGIIRIDANFNITYITRGIEGQFISSLFLTENGDLLAGTFDGLFLYKYSPDEDYVELAGRFEDIPYTNVQVIYQEPGNSIYYAGTEDQGVYRLNKTDSGNTSYAVQRVGLEWGIGESNIQDIFIDNEQNLWLATEGEGVIKLVTDRGAFIEKVVFNEASGLGTRYVRKIFEDIEGNFWFASYGGGLVVLRNQFFKFYSFKSDKFNDDVLSICSEDETFWLGSDNGVLKVDFLDKGKQEFLGTDFGLPKDKVTAIIKDTEGNMWIGTGRSGIFKHNKNAPVAKKYFSSFNSLENAINSLAFSDSKLYAATNGGLLVFNMVGDTLEKYTTFEGLPHNRIRHVLIDSKGKAWIATRSNGIYNIESKRELTIDARAEFEFVSIVEDKNGHLWAATNGDGVFMFADDSLGHYSTVNGLMSNYCYSLALDPDGMIWVGHSMGLSRIDPDIKQVQVFSVEQGVSTGSNYNSVLAHNNKIIFGTSKGIIVYDYARDKQKEIPPKLNITSLKINDRDYDYTAPIQLPYSIYKVRIDFIGINMQNPEKVTYQYKLEGYDDWSEMTSVPYINYSRVEDGEYTFLLRACNDKGICNEQPLALKISIKKPVWKTWWFFLIVLATLVLIVYTIIKQRERNQKLIQERLEKLLDERTKEVVAQKEVIENKNRDITDSINYAQRIQASILPPVNRLHKHFSGSFVFYQPKDIVSGDFYWYDKVWSNKFLIVCADSTGHGVPGAFMSMIGTTLIKDICARPEVRSPSSLLVTLDREIKEALNQNKEAEKSNDGMDILVAEIDLETKELRVSSAMRPMILYINGKQVYVKGSRNSVGGQLDYEVDDKEFAQEKFSLSKGDIIYMFSDGYPDQFGGPLGKKFKMVRLKNLLRDINDKSMDEQYQFIKSNFLLWKEDLEQVDDVLFMGIKI